MKKNKQLEHKKFTLSEFIWIGFNTTFNITFAVIFAQIMVSTAGTGLGVGVHILWIYLIDGIAAAICGLAYIRMSQIHKNGNGGAYIYVRTNFGIFWGWLVGFIQYTTFPLIITSQIVSALRINFVGSNTFLDTIHVFGNWSYLFWDLFGIGIFALISLVLFYGMRIIKKFLNYSSLIKWTSAGVVIIAAIVLFANDGTVHLKDNYEHSKISVGTFFKTFSICFFFFLGFESFVTMGENIENPKKNFKISVLLIMVVATIGYIVISIIFLGALASGFSTNPNLTIFKKLSEKYGNWIYVVGVLLFMICTFSLKMNATIQLTLFGSTIIQPLAKEGLFSEKYSTLDETNIPKAASKLNVMIISIVMFLFLIVPDIIQGSINSDQPVFSYSDITEQVSLVLILIYILVISTTIKCYFDKSIKINIFEIVVYFIGLIFLAVTLEEFFRSGISEIIDAFKAKEIGTILSKMTSIIALILIPIFAVIWYKLYYLPKYNKRIKENPQVQEQLDSEFVLNKQEIE